MKCYVYERVERVFYVVGVNEKGNVEQAFANALTNAPQKTIRGSDQDKPFRGFNDRRVMYIERLGCVPYGGRPDLEDALRARGKRRALDLTVEHSEDVVEVDQKPKRR